MLEVTVFYSSSVSWLASDKNGDGSKSVNLDRVLWNLFLSEQELRGDISGRGGDAELTHGCINTASIDKTADVDTEVEGRTKTITGSMKMWGC